MTYAIETRPYSDELYILRHNEAAIMISVLRSLLMVQFTHSWRGEFDIRDREGNARTYDGIQGHLPTCPVIEVIKCVYSLPEIIILDERPRLSIWPFQFTGAQVTKEDIHLYYFANDVNSIMHYNELMNNMIENDLALKANLDGAELLIFPSNILPQEIQRMNDSLFFWGVFCKEDSVKRTLETKEKESKSQQKLLDEKKDTLDLKLQQFELEMEQKRNSLTEEFSRKEEALEHRETEVGKKEQVLTMMSNRIKNQSKGLKKQLESLKEIKHREAEVNDRETKVGKKEQVLTMISHRIKNQSKGLKKQLESLKEIKHREAEVNHRETEIGKKERVLTIIFDRIKNQSKTLENQLESLKEIEKTKKIKEKEQLFAERESVENTSPVLSPSTKTDSVGTSYTAETSPNIEGPIITLQEQQITDGMALHSSDTAHLQSNNIAGEVNNGYSLFIDNRSYMESLTGGVPADDSQQSVPKVEEFLGKTSREIDNESLQDHIKENSREESSPTEEAIGKITKKRTRAQTSKIAEGEHNAAGIEGHSDSITASGRKKKRSTVAPPTPVTGEKRYNLRRAPPTQVIEEKRYNLRRRQT